MEAWSASRRAFSRHSSARKEPKRSLFSFKTQQCSSFQSTLPKPRWRLMEIRSNPRRTRKKKEKKKDYAFQRTTMSMKARSRRSCRRGRGQPAFQRLCFPEDEITILRDLLDNRSKDGLLDPVSPPTAPPRTSAVVPSGSRPPMVSSPPKFNAFAGNSCKTSTAAGPPSATTTNSTSSICRASCGLQPLTRRRRRRTPGEYGL